LSVKSIEKLAVLGFRDEIAVLEILTKLVETNSIIIEYCELPDEVKALLFEVKGQGPHIWMNERLSNIEDEPARKMALKMLFCHELAHLLLNHPGAPYVPPEGYQDQKTESLSEVAMQYALDPQVHGRYEHAAEIFAAAMGFWPQNKFVQLFILDRMDMRNISVEFKMPVDCVVKWAVVSLGFPMHYIKFNVSENKVEDFYFPLTPEYGRPFVWGFPDGVFAADGTTANKSLKQRADCVGPAPGGHFFCRAVYLNEDESLMRKHAKIYVAGCPIQTYEQIMKHYAQAKELVTRTA
jgi:hypothetical protein